MQPLETEALAHRPELLEEGLERPERRVVRLVGIAPAELVVEDDAPTLLGQGPEPFERIVRAPRAAVEGEERHATSMLGFAHDAVPRVVPTKRQPAFGRGHDARRQRRRRSFGASPRACAAESKSAAVKPAKSSASKFGLPARRSAWAFRACSKIVRA